MLLLVAALALVELQPPDSALPVEVALLHQCRGVRLVEETELALDLSAQEVLLVVVVELLVAAPLRWLLAAQLPPVAEHEAPLLPTNLPTLAAHLARFLPNLSTLVRGRLLQQFLLRTPSFAGLTLSSSERRDVSLLLSPLLCDLSISLLVAQDLSDGPLALASPFALQCCNSRSASQSRTEPLGALAGALRSPDLLQWRSVVHERNALGLSLWQPARQPLLELGLQESD